MPVRRPARAVLRAGTSGTRPPGEPTVDNVFYRRYRGVCAPQGPPRPPGVTALANDPADVLIVGAGASGGLVAVRLVEPAFRVVSQELAEWLDRADYPGNKPDSELKERK